MKLGYVFVCLTPCRSSVQLYLIQAMYRTVRNGRSTTRVGNATGRLGRCRLQVDSADRVKQASTRLFSSSTFAPAPPSRLVLLCMFVPRLLAGGDTRGKLKQIRAEADTELLSVAEMERRMNGIGDVVRSVFFATVVRS